MKFLSHRLRSLRDSENDPVLGFPPQELTLLEIVQVILIFICRQCLFILGIGNQIRVSKKDGTEDEIYLLPELCLMMQFRITLKDFKQYGMAVGSRGSHRTTIFNDPAQICLMLSAFSEPAFLLLLAHHKSPVLPLGSVNVRNKFELLRPDLCTLDTFDKTFHAARARLLPTARKVKRGLEIDVEVEILNMEKGADIFRQVFTILQFTKFKGDPTAPPVPVDDLPKPDGFPSVARIDHPFSMNQRLIMKWAMICKDYNPIHISFVAAKAFGFPGRIFHGNHVCAFGLHSVDLQQPQPIRSPDVKKDAWVVHVNFRKPVTAPANLSVQIEHEDDNGYSFKICNGDKVCITGSSKSSSDQR